ncbi:hypothetical protein F383_17895 [Gossypium arboreum]
MLYPG